MWPFRKRKITSISNIEGTRSNKIALALAKSVGFGKVNYAYLITEKRPDTPPTDKIVLRVSRSLMAPYSPQNYLFCPACGVAMDHTGKSIERIEEHTTERECYTCPSCGGSFYI